jgi:8-oxo-dGTP diphosphatase
VPIHIWADFGNSPVAKREPGETFEQCLVRELREELGVEVKTGGLFEEITHVYAEKPSI